MALTASHGVAMRAGSFDVRFGVLGPERVLINGADVSDLVDGVSMLSQHGQAPTTRLLLKPGVSVEEIKGDGVIEVQPAGGDIAGWLSNIDAGELERTVTERMSSMTMSQRGSPIAMTLAALREMAAGQ